MTQSPLQEEADRRNYPERDYDLRDTVHYFEFLYMCGRQIWSRSMLRELEFQVVKDPPPDLVDVQSMNGQMSLMDVPRPQPHEDHQPTGDYPMTLPQLVIKFHHYQELQSMIEDNIRRGIPNGRIQDLDEDTKKTLATRSMSLSLDTFPSAKSTYLKTRLEWTSVLRQQWPQSYTCAEMTNVIEEQARYIPSRIDKIVCFGLGSLALSIDAARVQTDNRYTALFLHAMALGFASSIAIRLGTDPPPVLCQDLSYTEADKCVLHEAGFKIIEGRGARGFTLVDDNSVVVTCRSGVPVKQIIADIAKPAMMIWDKVTDEPDEKWSVVEQDGREHLVCPYIPDNDSPRTRELVRGYDKWPFPEFGMDVDGDLNLYIRKDPEA